MGDEPKGGLSVTVENCGNSFAVPKSFERQAIWGIYFLAWLLFYFSGFVAWGSLFQQPCRSCCDCVMAPEIKLMFDCLEAGRFWCIDFALLAASALIELRTGRLMLISTSLAALAAWMLVFRLVSF